MIADSLPQEAMQRANSPEGMEQLVHALLYQVLDTVFEHSFTPTEQRLFERIQEYVLLKRIRQIHSSQHPRHIPFRIPYVTADEVYEARERYKEIEPLVLHAGGIERVQFLKRYWGTLLTFKRLQRLSPVWASFQQLHGH